jgi:CheY-like chemotaxis protein
MLEASVFLPAQETIGTVARILIVESHAEVRELLERVIGRLGHEAVPAQPGELDLSAIDACVLEPAVSAGDETARALAEAAIPTVCVSIWPPSAELRELEPAAYLLKPFSLGDLERALMDALRRIPRGPI